MTILILAAIVVIALLAIFAVGKFVEQQPACRIVQGCIAVVALLVIANRLGWF